MDAIKFSIIIPVYNCEKYIAECIDSVLNQTYQNFEILVVNDGSVDNSEYICKQYANKDARIKLFSTENRGVLLARQFAMEQISGDYCLFLDADDWWDTDLLQIVHNTILETSADMVVFNYKTIDFNGSIRYANTICDKKVFEANDKGKLFETAVQGPKWNSLCYKVVKSNIVKSLPKYQKRISMGEDALVSYRAMELCKKIVVIDNNLYNYRANVQGACNNFKLEYLSDFLIVHLERYNILIKYSNDSCVVKAFLKREITSLVQKVQLCFETKNSFNNKVNAILPIYEWELYKEFLNKDIALNKKYAKILKLISRRKFKYLQNLAAISILKNNVKSIIKKVLNRQ